MTRVNLEDELFGERRLFSLAQKMGWDRRTALGALSMLWHDSQGLLRIDGSAEELAEWGWCLDDAEGARFVSALLAAKYISPLENGRYLIHGNETQIDNIVQKTDASKKGGAATKAKWAAFKAARLADSQAARPSERQADDQAARPAEAGPAGLASGVPKGGRHQAQGKARQSKAGQGRAGQGRTRQDNAVLVPAGATPPATTDPPSLFDPRPDAKPDSDPAVGQAPGTKLWAAYCEGYVAKYGHMPVHNSKVASQCVQLVKRLGLDGALRVVAFYLTHSKRFYVETCHALGPCLQDAEALHTQMLANHRVSSADAHAEDRRQSNAQAFETAAAVLAAERETAHDQPF